MYVYNLFKSIDDIWVDIWCILQFLLTILHIPYL